MTLKSEAVDVRGEAPQRADVGAEAAAVFQHAGGRRLGEARGGEGHHGEAAVLAGAPDVGGFAAEGGEVAGGGGHGGGL